MSGRSGGRGPAFAAELARYLRQRRELGEPEFVFDGWSRDDALATLDRSAARRTVTPAPSPSAPSPTAMGAPATTRDVQGRDARALLALPSTLDELDRLCSGCERCRLHETRTQVVFADGHPDAQVIVVGEAPGANEDATGKPFVGAAGKLLDLLLLSVGLSRESSVYICNVIKCRPPGNRNPRPDEIESCAPYLRRQIEIIAPKAILAVGTFSGQLLSGEAVPLGRLRGRVFAYEGTPLVVTYHPAALLRNPGWTRPTWDDLQLLKEVIADGRAA